jgi:2-desacetyl-2-hydroxyethyl bacteriochlorophyllide A dehydrogenase
MKAAYYDGNETIRIGEGATPPPGRGEVQLRVAYTGICGTDLHIFHGKMDKRVKIPQVMGHELSGTIVALGDGVGGWTIGQPATVMPLDWCGDCPACRAGHTHICQKLKFLGIDTPGSFQERWNAPARVTIRLPETFSLRDGALIEPVAVACHDVRLGGVRPGELAVVIGGGPIGALIALVARSAGARVVVSEINPNRGALLREMGLDAVDPRAVDLAAKVESESGGAGADVVFEVTAHPSGIEAAVRLPRTRGRVVVVGIFSEPPKVDLFRFFWRELRLIGARVYEREDFEAAIHWAAANPDPLRRLVSAVYPLDRLADAFRRLEGGGDVMKVLVECGDEGK